MLSIVEQREIIFYGDELTAIRANDGRVYAGMTQMCNALGLDAQAQRRRIERHAVMNDGLKGVAKLATPGGSQASYMLRVDLVPLWLSGIRTSAVRDEIRPRLEKFQREAAAVLWEAFQDGRLTLDPIFSSLLEQDTPAVESYKMIAAMLRMAQTQVLLEARLDSYQGQLTDHSQRLESLEIELGRPDRLITPDEASQISQAVKAIGLVLSKKHRRNEYGAIYGEMYRKFGITSYKMLPAAMFDDCMAWLTEWYEELTGEALF